MRLLSYLVHVAGGHSDVFLNAPHLKRVYSAMIYGSKTYLSFYSLRFELWRYHTTEVDTVLQTFQAVSQLHCLQLNLKRDSEQLLITGSAKLSCRELDEDSDSSFEIIHFLERVQFMGIESVALVPQEARRTTAQIQGFLHSMKPSMSDLTCQLLVFVEQDLVSLLLPLLPFLQTLCNQEESLRDLPYRKRDVFRA
jgi:hypothetical protein